MDKNAKMENVTGKRKYGLDEGRDNEYSSLCANSSKRGRLDMESIDLSPTKVTSEQLVASSQLGLTTAFRQAGRAQ